MFIYTCVTHKNMCICLDFRINSGREGLEKLQSGSNRNMERFLSLVIVLYVAWLTYSHRGVEQKLDNYVENYLIMNYTLEDIREEVAAKNAELVQIKAQSAENEKKSSLLEATFARIEAKVIQLEQANIRLKEDHKDHNLLRKEQATKVKQLEAKVKHQELIILALQNERVSSAAPRQSSPGIDTSLAGENGSYRTCNEIRLADALLPSGMHWIDPDGNGVGDSPIYVYCNMTTGSTVIKHDSEGPVNVGHCAGVGCYSRTIKYNASMEQLSALAKCSAECHQSIRYDCYHAPLEVNNIAYSWWDDRSGSAKYFWSGVEDTGTHTCQCGIDGNCVEPDFKCNCDSLTPAQLFDSGVITDKNLLPITGLNFGRTQLKTSSGVHTLGSFECSGQGLVMPTSCEDLWRTGHSLSGIYLVMGSAMVETVFCDFQKYYDKAGFQKLIGYADVKSTPTFFNVQRFNEFHERGVPITFEHSLVNNGEAMDVTTGIFTANRAGTYFFSFSGLATLQAKPSQYFEITLYLNNAIISSDSIVGSVLDTDDDSWTLSLQTMVDLQPDDQICLKLSPRSQESYLLRVDRFIGWMLEEKIGATNS